MSKLNDLAGTLTTINTTLGTILTEVETGSVANPELPADAQTALDALQSNVTAIQTALVPPATPPPTP